jgi:hypothetical protein
MDDEDDEDEQTIEDDFYSTSLLYSPEISKLTYSVFASLSLILHQRCQLKRNDESSLTVDCNHCSSRR